LGIRRRVTADPAALDLPYRHDDTGLMLGDAGDVYIFT
jgi:hypothetical protein